MWAPAGVGRLIQHPLGGKRSCGWVAPVHWTRGRKLSNPPVRPPAWHARRAGYAGTHGGGVAWLHVRLSSKPKYFHTHEYMHAAG